MLSRQPLKRIPTHSSSTTALPSLISKDVTAFFRGKTIRRVTGYPTRPEIPSHSVSSFEIRNNEGFLDFVFDFKGYYSSVFEGQTFLLMKKLGHFLRQRVNESVLRTPSYKAFNLRETCVLLYCDKRIVHYFTKE